MFNMSFKLVLANYFLSLPGLSEREASLLINAVIKLKIPKYCVLVGLYYFEECLNSTSNIYRKLAASLYLGYRTFHDHYINVKYWSMFTKVDTKSVIHYENQILQKLNFSVHVNPSILDATLDQLINIKNSIYTPMSPVSPMLSPRTGFQEVQMDNK